MTSIKKVYANIMPLFVGARLCVIAISIIIWEPKPQLIDQSVFTFMGKRQKSQNLEKAIRIHHSMFKIISKFIYCILK